MHRLPETINSVNAAHFYGECTQSVVETVRDRLAEVRTALHQASLRIGRGRANDSLLDMQERVREMENLLETAIAAGRDLQFPEDEAEPLTTQGPDVTVQV